MDFESPARSFDSISNRIRRKALEMAHAAGTGHPGGDLSATDILVVLYFRFLRYDPKAPNWPLRDIFILSKGHASAALYSTLAEVGFFDYAELDTFLSPGSRLTGHPSCRLLPGVETSTGPLGHGLPIGVGFAIAAKLDGAERKVVVLTGDGELQEGSNWEAAMFASHRKLDNLIVIVDRNRLQQGGATEETNALEPLADKWRAFGWSVRTIDGHDCDALFEALSAAPLDAHRPTCLVAETVKGKGVSFMENLAGWHHRIPTRKELDDALLQLSQRP